jgi:hypothetical protein
LGILLFFNSIIFYGINERHFLLAKIMILFVICKCFLHLYRQVRVICALTLFTYNASHYLRGIILVLFFFFVFFLCNLSLSIYNEVFHHTIVTMLFILTHLLFHQFPSLYYSSTSFCKHV